MLTLVAYRVLRVFDMKGRIFFLTEKKKKRAACALPGSEQ